MKARAIRPTNAGYTVNTNMTYRTYRRKIFIKMGCLKHHSILYILHVLFVPTIEPTFAGRAETLPIINIIINIQVCIFIFFAQPLDKIFKNLVNI